jgi:hypothetical protein
MIDLEEGTIGYSLNGTFLGVAFLYVDLNLKWYPAISFTTQERGRLYFHDLRHCPEDYYCIPRNEIPILESDIDAPLPDTPLLSVKPHIVTLKSRHRIQRQISSTTVSHQQSPNLSNPSDVVISPQTNHPGEPDLVFYYEVDCQSLSRDTDIYIQIGMSFEKSLVSLVIHNDSFMVVKINDNPECSHDDMSILENLKHLFSSNPIKRSNEVKILKPKSMFVLEDVEVIGCGLFHTASGRLCLFFTKEGVQFGTKFINIRSFGVS